MDTSLFADKHIVSVSTDPFHIVGVVCRWYYFGFISLIESRWIRLGEVLNFQNWLQAFVECRHDGLEICLKLVQEGGIRKIL
jgi:hypothetical protein